MFFSHSLEKGTEGPGHLGGVMREGSDWAAAGTHLTHIYQSLLVKEKAETPC
jgi:hypothetical protein